jgi:hypothetical protein
MRGRIAVFWVENTAAHRDGFGKAFSRRHAPPFVAPAGGAYYRMHFMGKTRAGSRGGEDETVLFSFIAPQVGKID